MATHFICQSTEPLPHRYPSRLGGKSHGAVSQYEVYNAASKAHTRFPPPGWDFSQSSEDDSLPLLRSLPQPAAKNSSFLYDPELCITPQKSKGPGLGTFSASEGDIFRKHDINPDPDLTLTPMRASDDMLKPSLKYDCDKTKKQKVRFDIDESVSEEFLTKNVQQKSSPDKAYQPELYGDADDDDFEMCKEDVIRPSSSKPDNARTVRYTVGNVGDQAVYVALGNEQTQKEENVIKSQTDPVKIPAQTNPKSQTLGQKLVKVVREKSSACARQAPVKQGPGKGDQTSQGLGEQPVDHIAVCKVPEKSGPKRKAKVLRENQYTPKETEYTYPFHENGIDDYVGGEEHMFARPEYNSTLRMKLEAERLKEASVDLDTALQRKLKMSESVKTEINEKAASLVNTEGSTFSGLVSLNVPVDELCKEAVEIKTARAKQIKLPKCKAKDYKEPDLLEFFSSDRQKESVTYSLPGISSPSEQLSTASHWRAFDLYKHNRVWERTGKM